MIKDAQGRKWFMRFRRYRNGWHWEARHKNHGQQQEKCSGPKLSLNG